MGYSRLTPREILRVRHRIQQLTNQGFSAKHIRSVLLSEGFHRKDGKPFARSQIMRYMNDNRLNRKVWGLAHSPKDYMLAEDKNPAPRVSQAKATDSLYELTELVLSQGWSAERKQRLLVSLLKGA